MNLSTLLTILRRTLNRQPKDVSGIFALNKPVGISSQRAVQIVKWWAKRATGEKKIRVGHGGTLDPLAEGVLVIAVGREYTKQLDTVVASQKEYMAEVTLGQTTTTDDREGEMTVVSNRIVQLCEIEKLLPTFVGDVTQVPPVFSAIKMDGQEAYKRARRGEVVEMKERVVHIDAIEIVEYVYPVISLRITCGKGTYIRSLARDIGAALDVGGYMSALTRTRVGSFILADAKNVKDFQ